LSDTAPNSITIDNQEESVSSTIMNSVANNWQFTCTKSLKDYLRESLILNQVESTPETSVNDVVIEMENLSLELEKTVEEKPKNKNINIYINHSEEDEREQFLLKHEKKDDCEDEEESNDDDEIEDRDTPYFIEWQAPIVEWLAPIRDWQGSLNEYQENLLEWYVPYGSFGHVGDGDGLGEDDIFQP